MKHVLLLTVSMTYLGYGSTVFANDVAMTDETAPLSMANILKWNSEYRANEPSGVLSSESQVSGPPEPLSQVPASIPVDNVTIQYTQISDQIPTSRIDEEDTILSEGSVNKTVVPVVKPKETAAPKPLNKPKGNVPTFEIGLPLLLDERYLGDLAVRVAGDKISLPVNKLIDLVAPDFTASAISALESSALEGYLEIGTFSVEGVNFNYNPQLQQIEVISSINSREVRVLKFGVDERERQQVLEEPANFSLFVSPTISAEYVWDDDSLRNNNLSPFGAIDIGGRVGGVKGLAFLSRQRFDTRDGFDFSRDETQLIYDSLPRLMRITAGDLRPRGDNLQSIPSMAGLSVERFFDLEPNRLFRPTSQTSFELERPSTVEIRINGVTQREIFLRPGRYDLRDLPLVQGSNLVDVVIRDDLGRERIIADRNFFDFGLLEKGLWDYSFSAGVRSDFDQNGIDYSDDPVVTAFIRGGITKSLTAGADIQADAEGVNGGVSTLWASPLGVFRGGLSASQRDVIGTGVAVDAAFNATGYLGDDAKTRWSATIGGRFNSRDFSVLPVSVLSSTIIAGSGIGSEFGGPVSGIQGGRQTTKLNLNGGLQVSQNKWSATANANYIQSYGDRRDTYNFIGGVNYALSPQLSAGVFMRHIRSQLEEETGANFQITWRPRRNHDVRARYDTLRQEAQLTYSRSAAAVVRSLNYSIGALSNFETNSYAFSGDAFYIGNRFEASARHAVFTGAGTNNQTRQVSRASIRSSIAYADGAIAIGRPIGEAFVIVDQHKSLAGKKVYIDPREEGHSSSSGALGSALAAEIGPFTERSVYYDVEDLPAGYDLGEGQFNVKPPLNAGYKVQVGSGASFTMIGQVVNSLTGENVPYVGGRLESKDRPASDPVLAFTNRNGRLAATGLVPGNYTLILLTEPNHKRDIVIPEDGESLVNIGDILVIIPE